MRCNTPPTARVRRGRLLTTLQPTKRQPATAGAVERGGRVTTARRTTTRAAPGCNPPPHSHAGAALRQLTMHISTNDLHCCKPSRLLQWAPSVGRPRRRPLATTPPRTSTTTTDCDGRPIAGRQQMAPPQLRRSKDVRWEGIQGKGREHVKWDVYA
jgi:hypothetical protein